MKLRLDSLALASAALLSMLAFPGVAAAGGVDDAKAVAFADARRLAAHQSLRSGRQRAARHILLHLPKAGLELGDALLVSAHRIVGIAHR